MRGVLTSIGQCTTFFLMRPCLALRPGPLIFLFVVSMAACVSVPAVVDRPVAIRDTGQENVIVFVHGVLGDADTTWRNTETGSYWPELVARDSDFTNFDVYTVGYESPAMSRTSTTEEVAQRVLQQLRDRRVFDRYKQIHFIAHSMGGLVVKRMLLQLNRPIEVDSLRRVRTVLFLSTPSQGAQTAELGTLLAPIRK